MKIRCEQNSIRVRLRKSEIVQLRVENWLEAAIHFPDGQVFAWELLLEESLQDIAAHFENGRLCVKLPASLAQNWMDTEEVSMECFIPVGEGHALHVLIEKDFPCKDRPDEDKTDFFTELAADAPLNC
ncbi:MAG: hypothetical protein H6574_05055 [Lewinellaceae bacterium]|nr:hypothetical protein [Saprospiraceae bacterium]MCB9330432.1 hypothetical protein [Lewinellaceae bacterium]